MSSRTRLRNDYTVDNNCRSLKNKKITEVVVKLKAVHYVAFSKRRRPSYQIVRVSAIRPFSVHIVTPQLRFETKIVPPESRKATISVGLVKLIKTYARTLNRKAIPFTVLRRLILNITRVRDF